MIHLALIIFAGMFILSIGIMALLIIGYLLLVIAASFGLGIINTWDSGKQFKKRDLKHDLKLLTKTSFKFITIVLIISTPIIFILLFSGLFNS